MHYLTCKRPYKLEPRDRAKNQSKGAKLACQGNSAHRQSTDKRRHDCYTTLIKPQHKHQRKTRRYDLKMENKIIQDEHMHFKDTLCTQTLASTPNSTVKNRTNPTVQRFNRLVENYCKKIAIENGENGEHYQPRRDATEREREREKKTAHARKRTAVQ